MNKNDVFYNNPFPLAKTEKNPFYMKEIKYFEKVEKNGGSDKNRITNNPFLEIFHKNNFINPFENVNCENEKKEKENPFVDMLISNDKNQKNYNNNNFVNNVSCNFNNKDNNNDFFFNNTNYIINNNKTDKTPIIKKKPLSKLLSLRFQPEDFFSLIFSLKSFGYSPYIYLILKCSNFSILIGSKNVFNFFNLFGVLIIKNDFSKFIFFKFFIFTSLYSSYLGVPLSNICSPPKYL